MWWAELSGLHHSIEPVQAYSDGHNLTDVYLGLILMALAVIGLFVGSRPASARAVRKVAGFGAGISFLLALGPSLRVADFGDMAADSPITYSMPTLRKYKPPLGAGYICICQAFP